MARALRQPSVVDIARAIGVSPSTVCRALNGKGEINPTTRRKVLRATERIGYVRNAAASDLRLRRSRTIACLMTEGDNELLIDKLHHLKKGALEAGHTWRFTPYRGEEDQRRLLHEVISSRPAGLVLKARLDDESRQTLLKNRIATVSYDEDLVAFDSVVLDRARGVREAVLFLLGKGRRRILLLGSGRRDVRGTGYLSAHAQARVRVDKALVIDVPFGRDLYTYGYEQIRRLLGEIRFDAVVAVNDACAIGAMRALREAELSIPADVGIIGFDNIMVSRFTVPALTTVAQPIEQMADRALSFLFKRMKDTSAPRRVARLSTSLIVRESA